jgi:hypothetical protein
VVVVVVAALSATACGSEDAAETSAGTTAAATPATTEAPPAETDTPTKATAAMTFDAEPGEVLTRFVEAAADEDVATMWRLLSTPTRERLGPTRADFADEYLAGFRDGLGTFAGTDPEVVVSGADGNGWGVAALAGDRVRRGEQEFATYAAALRVEDGEWRLELGAPIRLRYLDRSPPGTVDVEIEAGNPIEAAGLWVAGEPTEAVVQGTDLSHFVVHAEQVPTTADRPVGVVFARTGDEAQAGAFALDEPATGA